MALGPQEVLLRSKEKRLADEIEGMIDGRLRGIADDKEKNPGQLKAKCKFELKGFSDEEGTFPEIVGREIRRRYLIKGWSSVNINDNPREKGSYILVLEY